MKLTLPLLAVCVGCVIASHWLLPPIVYQRQVGLDRLPVKAAEFMRTNGIKGNVWHPWTYEAYLHWAVPGIKTGMGGRAQQVHSTSDCRIHFNLESAAHLTDAHMEARNAYFRRHAIRTILIDAQKHFGLMMRLMEFGWQSIYFDGRDCILVRDWPSDLEHSS